MPVPQPTPVYRIVHLDNLPLLLHRQGLHAPNHQPSDGHTYRTIHNTAIQQKRRQQPIPCGPRGVIHDYISFYFGPRSPMLLQLHTGRVEGHREGQAPIVYLVSSVQRIAGAGLPFVFSDGHGIKAFTRWFSNLDDLGEVDWPAAYATHWQDTITDMDRQRRKQAEFLVHRFCPWTLIDSIGVSTPAIQSTVQHILATVPSAVRPVIIKSDWYY